MDLQGVKRASYWACFFIFMLILFLTLSSQRMTFFMRMIVIILLAFLSAFFRLEKVHGILSIALTCLAGTVIASILANSQVEFWLFAIIFIAGFFSSAYVWEKNLLGA